MPEMTVHPSREQLSAYSLGQLPPDEAVVVESHVSECEPCCDTIINLSAGDTFVGLLKEARQLPTGQKVDHDAATASSSCQDVPVQLVEHPRYEIVGLIGKGGMGDVYKARHRKMERTVALKVVNRGLVQKTEAVDRFHREVKAAAQLSHPNIVTAHDADQAGDFHFMVMEYVDGVDLSKTVTDRGALPVAEACDYIRQAAIGLQHAHECGMVHRDIKPHNLMVTSDGTVKILDFGLASLAPEAIADADTDEARGDLTAAGAIMGTPDFISPEQADDARKADIRSDIYSLGATLYFLLAGRPPFAEGSLTQKLQSHAQAEPQPLESLRDDVPPELVAIVTRMTAKDAAGRFQTPAEVAEALKRFSRSVDPRKDAEPQAQAKPRRWKPTFLSLTAVAALFVAAIVAGVIFYLQTDHGVVRVEVTDPLIQVTISDETITMKHGGEKSLKIRPGKQTLIVRKDDADFEFETDRFQIRRGDEIAFKVEMLEGEIVVRKNGERFQSKALTEDVRVQQILDQMKRAYAECKSYRDSGVIKSVFFESTGSPESTVEHSFTTVFERPDRFRFEIKDEDDDKLVISVNGQNVQTWWDVEPGIQRPESLELAMAQALGFAGADVGRIPALLMPEKLEGYGDLNIIDPKLIEDGNLQGVECFRLEYNFRDEQIVLWIDKQSYLVRQIDERMKTDGIRIERTTTYEPTVDGKITDEMLEFLPEGDLKQLQGDWNVIAFTQNGKKEFAADKGVGMQLQIKGDTITRIQSRPGGEKLEKEWGRIELNNKTNPKSIDIVNPDGPGGRLLGIYELKDGTLNICFAERTNVDVAQERAAKRPTMFAAPAGSDLVLLECERKRPEVNTDASAPRTILDQGYTILDVGKEIGSRRLVVTENDQTLSIVEEYSLALKFEGAPLGIVERDFSAVYSVAGDTPVLMRGTTSTKEQGALVMHGTAEFSSGEALTSWTSYTDGGRKLDPPTKQQATVKPPPGPLVLGSTIQVVGPLLLPEEGECKVVVATFNNKVRNGKPLVEYEAGCRLERTSRPEGAGFTITVFEPESDEPEMTWEYDRNGNCQSIQLSRTTVMKPREAADDGSDKEQMPDIEAERKTTAVLIESARQGDVAAVKAALKAGVNPNGPANQLTALHWAVAKRLADGETIDPSPEIAKLLIDAGADVNAKDYLDQTPLEWAAKFASPDIVEMLIKAGADVNAESRYGTVLQATKDLSRNRFRICGWVEIVHDSFCMKAGGHHERGIRSGCGAADGAVLSVAQ